MGKGRGEGEDIISRVCTHKLKNKKSSSSSVQCYFASTNTVRTIRDRGAQDGHLDFDTAPEL